MDGTAGWFGNRFKEVLVRVENSISNFVLGELATSVRGRFRERGIISEWF